MKIERRPLTWRESLAATPRILLMIWPLLVVGIGFIALAIFIGGGSR